MHEASRNDVTDGVRWRCPICKTSKSIRHGSFFSKSRLPLQKWLLLLYLWARDYPVKDVAQEAEIDKNVACDVMNWLREVCSTKLLQMPISLGGPSKIVQIDESLFRHKPKVQIIAINMHTTQPEISYRRGIMAGQLHRKFGYLVWLTFPMSLHWDTCRLFHKEMLQRFCQ